MGNEVEAAVNYPLIRDLDPEVDLNEASWDWPPAFKVQVLEKISELEWSRYPSDRLAEFEHRLAVLLAVPQSTVMLVPGSMMTIVEFFRQFIAPAKAYIQPQSSFFMYLRLARRFGVDKRTFPLGDAGQYCLSEVISACRDHPDLPVVLCAPNNPTGGHLSVSEIGEVAAATHAPILLDGTYSWFAESFQTKDISDLLRLDNLAQSYSFSKSCALAGVRLGFAVLPPRLKLAFESERLPYTFNLFALSVLSVLLEDNWWRYMWNRIASVRDARQVLIAQLTEIEEISLFPSQANFVTISVGGRDRAVREALIKAGLPFKSLHHGMIRITVGSLETIQTYTGTIANALKR